MSELWEAIRPELLSFVVTLLGLFLTLAVNSLRRKFDNDTAGAILDQVEKAASLVVRELEQTMVPEVKAALEDGKLTKEEADKLKAIAIERVQAHVGKKVPVALIVSAIEAAVHKLKSDRE